MDLKLGGMPSSPCELEQRDALGATGTPPSWAAPVSKLGGWERRHWLMLLFSFCTCAMLFHFSPVWSLNLAHHVALPGYEQTHSSECSAEKASMWPVTSARTPGYCCSWILTQHQSKKITPQQPFWVPMITEMGQKSNTGIPGQLPERRAAHQGKMMENSPLPKLRTALNNSCCMSLLLGQPHKSLPSDLKH